MASELRLALFSGNYNYQTDGANKALNRLVSYFERQGVEVIVFSPTSAQPAFEPAGTLVSVPSVPVPGRGEYRIGFGLTDKLKKQIKKFSPNLIHLSAPDVLGHSALKFAKQIRVPAVASFHTRFDAYLKFYKIGWAAPYCRKRMAQFYERCAQVYVPSHSVKKVLQEENIVGENVSIWSRGIDRTRFSPEFRDMEWRRGMGIADDDIALGFVGRLVKEKGLDEYANLIDDLTKRGLPVKALIVGDGPEKKSIRQRLPKAILTGHVVGRDLSRAFASCDLFVNPSRTETFGNVTLEAMASGVPAICVDATGSRDLVENGNTGWLISGADSADWLEKTAGLCTRIPLRMKMSSSARKASADYDWDLIMKTLLGQYLHIIESRRHLDMALVG